MAAVEGGAGTLIVESEDAGRDRAPIPSLLACGAVHHALGRERLRSRASLVVVADDVFDVHGVATLLGYGADAICPRLALATVAAEADRQDDGDLTSPEAQGRFQAAIEAGVLKILSKMGICTVDSYRGAQIFEVVGLAAEVVDVCFTGTPNVVGGIGWQALGEDVLSRHGAAWGGADLESPGFFRVRKGGEPHGKDKDTVQALNDLTLVQEKGGDGQDRDMLVAHLLQAAIRSESSSATTPSPSWPTTGPSSSCTTCWSWCPPPSPSRSTRSRPRPTSPGGSPPGPCPTGRCPRRPTRRWPRP